MVWLVCGYFGWFVGGLACLWVVSSFTANGTVIGNFKKEAIEAIFITPSSCDAKNFKRTPKR